MALDDNLANTALGSLILRKLGIALAAVGALALLAYGGWQLMKWKFAASNLAQEVTKARGFGIPFDASELKPRQQISDDENAGPVLVQIGDDLNASKKKADALRNLDVIMANEPFDLASAQANIDLLKPELVAARQAAAKKNCDFDQDYDLGVMMQLPELSASRSAVKALIYSAYVRARTEDWPGAISELVAARRLAGYIGEEPAVISLLVCVSELDSVSRASERLLSNAASDPAKIALLVKFQQAAPPLPSFWGALRGEAYSEIVTIRNFDALGGERLLSQTPDSSGTPAQPNAIRRTGLPTDSKERAYLCRMLELWNRALTQVPQREDGEKLAAALENECNKIANSNDPSQLLNRRLFSPVFSNAAYALRRSEAIRRASLALGLCLAYRAAHKDWPNSVAEAGFSLPDPFGGAPLRLKKVRNGLRVYSIGQNLADDNGEAPYMDASKDDIPVYYPVSDRLNRPRQSVIRAR